MVLAKEGLSCIFIWIICLFINLTYFAIALRAYSLLKPLPEVRTYTLAGFYLKFSLKMGEIGILTIYPFQG